jgi:flavoprotein
MTTQKIDVNEAKRLRRIHTGKDIPESRYEKKLLETQLKMDVNKVLADIKACKDCLKNFEEQPGLETKNYLFAFKGKYHLIEGSQYRRIEDGEARMKLDENSEMQLYYICTNEKMCPLPNLFSGKNAKALMLKNDQEVIERIKSLTGVTIKKSEL